MQLADIDQHWATIEPGLLHVKRKTGGHWLPDELRKACRRKHAFLFIAPEGFVIVAPVHSSGSIRLDVRVAYGLGQGLMTKYLPVLDTLARDIGATRMTMSSPRRGFEKDPEWSISSITYERKVPDES